MDLFGNNSSDKDIQRQEVSDSDLDDEEQKPIDNDINMQQEREVSGLHDGKITVPNCSKCQILKPPSTTCKFGHMLCFECGYANNNCPFVGEDGTACGEKWVKIPLGALEVYYSAYNTNAFPCPNNWVGCSSVMFGYGLDAHLESECQFSPVKRCPLTPCPMKNIHVSNYMEHLKKDHTYVKLVDTYRSCVISTNFVYTKSHVTRSYRALSCFGGVFLLIIHDYEDRIAFWVCVVTKPVEKNFKATIKIPYDTKESKPNGDLFMKHHEIVSTHNVHSLNKSYEQILKEGECIDMNKDTFEFPPGMRERLGVQPFIIDYAIEEVPLDLMQTAPLDLMEAAPLNLMEAAPLNLIEAAPLNLMEAAPLNLMEAAPLNLMKAAPLNLMEAAPIGLMKAALLGLMEAAPLDLMEAAPLNLMEAAPLNLMEAAPLDLMEAAPLDLMEAAPLDLMEAAPLDLMKAAPLDLMEADLLDLMDAETLI